MRIRLTLIVLILSAVLFPMLAKQPKSDGQSLDKLRFLFQGMKQERLKLKKAIFRIAGESSEKHRTKPADDLTGPVAIFGAFDDDLKLLRFDRSSPGWLAKPGAPAEQAQKGIVSAKYCRSKDTAAFWVVGQRYLSLHSADYKPPSGTIDWFDVRGLGLYGAVELRKGLSLIELFNNYLSNSKGFEIEEATKKEWIVRWTHERKSASSVWEIRVALDQGFAPLRSELKERPKANSEKWIVVQSYKTKWTNIDGVWVPTQHERMTHTLDGDYDYKSSLDIKWESINKEVPGQLFSYESFGAPPTVSIVRLQ